MNEVNEVNEVNIPNIPNIPTSYKIQDGCHNCSHCFIRSEYDDGSTYYCTFHDPNRPKCGSVAMNENWSHINKITGKSEFDPETMDKWYIWENNKEVFPSGICKFWKNKIG